MIRTATGSRSGLEERIKGASGRLVFLSFLMILISVIIFYYADEAKKTQTKLIDSVIDFNSPLLKEAPSGMEDEINFLIENNYFFEPTEESAAVIEAKNILSESNLNSLEGRYFPNLWRMLRYLHYSEQSSAAEKIEIEFARNETLWDSKPCEANEPKTTKCMLWIGENSINVSGFFHHLEDIYINKSLLHYSSGQFTTGYNLSRAADRILLASKVENGTHFSANIVNKAQLLSAISTDIYAQRMSLNQRDILFLINEFEADTQELIEHETDNAKLAGYLSGVNFLRNGCYIESAKTFASTLGKFNEETGGYEGRFAEIVNYMAIRAISFPLRDLRQWRLSGTDIQYSDPEKYYRDVAQIQNCEELIKVTDYVDMANSLSINLKSGSSYAGLRMDLEVFWSEAFLDKEALNEQFSEYAAERCARIGSGIITPSLSETRWCSQGRIVPVLDTEKMHHSSDNANTSVDVESNRASPLPETEGDADEWEPLSKGSVFNQLDNDFLGNADWIWVASRRDRAEAEAVASWLKTRDLKSIGIVHTKNNWFTIVIGPFPRGAGLEEMESLVGQKSLPTDSLLRRGIPSGDIDALTDDLLIGVVDLALEQRGCPVNLERRLLTETMQAVRIVLGAPEMQGDRSGLMKGLGQLIAGKGERDCQP